MSDIKHYSWCAAAQNMARPRSQQLIGPMCECAKFRREQKEWKDRVESGEFNQALGIIKKNE